MALFNQNWIGVDGQPVTGRVPTQMVVAGGAALTSQQEGAVYHAYKLFCDAVAGSAFPMGYHVQNRRFADGTVVRMESNGGVHRVFVQPTGGRDVTELSVLASPRIVDYAPLGDATGSVVYQYSVKLLSVTQKKPRVFGVVGATTAVVTRNAQNHQPGNATWFDGRDGHKSPVVSWWSLAPSGAYRVDNDSLIFQEGAGYGIYVDGKEVHRESVGNSVLGAGIFVDGTGRRWLRYAIKTGSFELKFITTPLGAPGSPSETTTVTVSDWFSQYNGRMTFNSSGTKAVTIEGRLSPQRICVVEYDPATGAATEVLLSSGTQTRSTPAAAVKCYAADDGGGYTTTAGGMTVINKSSTAEWVAYRESIRCRPAGAGYQGDELVIYELEDHLRHDTTVTATLDCSGSFSHTWTWGAAPWTSMRVSVDAAGGSMHYREDVHVVDTRKSRYRVFETVGSGARSVVYDPGWKQVFSRDYTDSGRQAWSYGAMSYTVPNDGSDVRSTYDDEIHAYYANPTVTENYRQVTRTFSGNAGDRRVEFIACRPEQRYIALAVWEWSQTDKGGDGRYRQTATVVEVKGGAVVGSTSGSFSTLPTSGVVLQGATSTDIRAGQNIGQLWFSPDLKTTITTTAPVYSFGFPISAPGEPLTTFIAPYTPYSNYVVPVGSSSAPFAWLLDPYFKQWAVSPSVAFEPTTKSPVALVSATLLGTGAPLVVMTDGDVGVMSGGMYGSYSGGYAESSWTTAGGGRLLCLLDWRFSTEHKDWPFPAPPLASQTGLKDYGYTKCVLKSFGATAVTEVDAKAAVLAMVPPANQAAASNSRMWLSHPYIPRRR